MLASLEVTAINRKSNLRLQIVYKDPTQLPCNASNPRKHPKSQLKRLRQSIKAFGCIVPIILDEKGAILSGNAIVQAAIAEGLAELPTISVEHLTDIQKQAFIIANNRLAELSSWDDQRLGEVLRDLSLADLDFDIEMIGFDMGEIDFRIEGLANGAEIENADYLPPVITPIAASKQGDVWLLGGHRVLCGDALDGSNYAVLLGTELAASVFTDHPYNVVIDGNVGGLGATRHREFAMAAGEMSEAEFRSFLLSSVQHMANFSMPGAVMYFCMDWRHGREMYDAVLGAGLTLLNRCTWVKKIGGMGSFYRSRHEDVYVARNGNTPHRNNVELGRHGRNRTNIWEYASPASFGRVGEEGRLLDLHPTVKPVAMVADAILDSTARGDIVLDAFLGSGTTVIAAEKVGRRCFGMELDPLYVDTIIQRWQAWTGQEAVLASTGQTFAEVAASREVAHV